MIRFRSLVLAAALLMLVGGVGCKSNNEQAGAPATASNEQQPAAVQPASAPEQPAPDKISIQGKVLETIDAASYTYVNVDTGSGQQWVAIPAAKLEVGQQVTFAPGMEMKDLESKTLNRTFDSVIFSSGIVSPAGSETASASAPAANESFDQAMQEEGAGAAAGQEMAGELSSGGSAAAVVPSSDVKVDKAEGENAYTVGEIFAQKKELDGKKVEVRGKVMKVSKMIMGKNWVHLQDGTGDAMNNTHDLVVTTSADPEKGSVIVVEGTLHADRDFGSGYRYDAIIEDATVK